MRKIRCKALRREAREIYDAQRAKKPGARNIYRRLKQSWNRGERKGVS